MTFPQSLRQNYSENSNTILLETVLRLLVEQLEKLSHSSFFTSELSRYVSQLRESVDSLQKSLNETNPPVAVITAVVESIWRATQFLTGTTSNRVPYEVTYLLREVLTDWGRGDSIVTTSLVQSPDFHCERVHSAPRAVIRDFRLPGLAISGDLVQIGVPEIFQHMPLLCSPLYHEVGHYIEEHQRLISELMIARGEDAVLATMPHIASEFRDSSMWRDVARSYAMEHFCDLIAAAYVGECVSDYIIQWDHSTTSSPTHPSAAERAKVTRDFLEGKHNSLVELLKQAVKEVGLPMELERRFIIPSVNDCFSDVRPATINSVAELHGLLPAADQFLKKLRNDPSQFEGTNIAKVSPSRHPQLINDLIERSIRSHMITKAWDESLDKKANP
ncbi:MAG: hypothetical protein QM740_06215 [Acidovorax sp.]